YFYKFLYDLYSVKSVDLVICQTKEMKAQLLDNVRKLNYINVTVIDNPIDLCIPAELSNTNVGFNDFILAIGRLHPIKRFDKLISAYKESYKLQKHKLLILGEGSERHFLERLIEEHNLNDRVFLIGHVENVFK